MPMEHMYVIAFYLFLSLELLISRKRLMEDVSLYPEFGGPRKTSQQSQAIVSI